MPTAESVLVLLGLSMATGFGAWMATTLRRVELVVVKLTTLLEGDGGIAAKVERHDEELRELQRTVEQRRSPR